MSKAEEKAIRWFENIAEECDKLTSGNAAHLKATIKGMAIRSAEYLTKYKQEPASEDLEKASEDYAYTNWESDDYHEGASEGLPFDAIGHAQKCFIDGAQWQKTQDQQTIELAEEHAMLAGMMQEREQMMKNAIDAAIVEVPVGRTGSDLDLLMSIPENLGLKDGDEVKVIIIKE